MLIFSLDVYENGNFRGPFTPGVSINAAMTPGIQLSLKSMESLPNGLQPHSPATALISMKAVSLVIAVLMRRLGINGSLTGRESAAFYFALLFTANEFLQYNHRTEGFIFFIRML